MAIREYKGPGGKYQEYFKFEGKMYSKVVMTKGEGRAWGVAKRKELREQKDQKPVLMFSEASYNHLQDCDARMQAGTVQEKKHHLTEFAQYMVEKHTNGDFPIGEVTVARGRDFIAFIQSSHGNKSANRRLRTLKTLWNWHKGELPSNPFSAIPKYPEDAFTKYVPLREDVDMVLARALLWEKRMLYFVLLTGARLSEMLQLTWDDVDFERKTILLWTRKRKGGSRQSKLMPITPRLNDILHALEQERRDGHMHVFINPNTDGPYTKLQPSIRYMLKRLCKVAEVKEFGFHALRHYAASQLLQSQKANLVEIQQFLGHQRPTTTDLYLRSMSSGISHLASTLDEIVSESQSEENQGIHK